MTLEGSLENRDGSWVLSLTRDFRHAPEQVWPWLVDPDRLRQWSPVVPDRPFDDPGPRQVRETPEGTPVDGEVLHVNPPHELVHRWGDDVVRWRLTATPTGCRLLLEQTMADRGPAAMNAAGWHICLDVLDDVLAGKVTPRAVGEDAAARGWADLRDGYAAVLGD